MSKRLDYTQIAPAGAKALGGVFGSMNAWVTPNFVKAVEATQAEGFPGCPFLANPERSNRE